MVMVVVRGRVGLGCRRETPHQSAAIAAVTAVRREAGRGPGQRIVQPARRHFVPVQGVSGEGSLLVRVQIARQKRPKRAKPTVRCGGRLRPDDEARCQQNPSQVFQRLLRNWSWQSLQDLPRGRSAWENSLSSPDSAILIIFSGCNISAINNFASY